MTFLLDVSVLIALHYPDHIAHERVSESFRADWGYDWASCPITENGFFRVISQPGFPADVTLEDARAVFAETISQSQHTFWSDDISLRDPALFDWGHIQGHRQITDIYLIGLAARHDGKFVTLDQRLNGNAIRNAQAELIIQI